MNQERLAVLIAKWRGADRYLDKETLIEFERDLREAYRLGHDDGRRARVPQTETVRVG